MDLNTYAIEKLELPAGTLLWRAETAGFPVLDAGNSRLQVLVFYQRNLDWSVFNNRQW